MDLDLIRLRELPETSELTAFRDFWAQALREMVQDPLSHPVTRTRLQGEVRQAEARLKLSAERDRLQTQRPPGCDCLGTGHRPYRAILREGLQARFCAACPEGAAAAEAEAQERALRERASLERRRAEILAHSRIAEHYPRFRDLTLRTFVPASEQLASYAQVCRYAAGDGHSLLLFGPPSRGKTGLAIAAVRERALREGAGFLVWNAVDLLTGLLRRIRATSRGGAGDGDPAGEADTPAEDPVARAERVRYLLLDDFDKLGNSDFQARVLYELVNQRYDRQLPTLFTANLSRHELVVKLGAHVTDRIFDMCGPAWVLELQGPNRRLDDRRPPAGREPGKNV